MTSNCHIGYGIWFLRETVREHPEAADVDAADAKRPPAIGRGVAGATGHRNRTSTSRQ